jgi:uncharacterized membrane protein
MKKASTQDRALPCDAGRMSAGGETRYPGSVGLSRWLSCVLAVALAGPFAAAPRIGWGAPGRKAKEAKEAKTTAEEEAALAEARDLFEQGKAKYDTFDYNGAIELWQLAYSKVPPREAGVRHSMVYNIALAQEKAYDVDKDAQHLRQAVLLLEQWVKDFKAMYERTPETAAEVEKANERIAELKRKITIAEGGSPPPPAEDPPAEAEEDDPPPPSSTIEFDSGYTPPPEVLRERRRQAAENESEGLIAAGWAVGGIGVLFAAAGAGTLAGVRNTAGRGGGGGGLGLGLSMIIAGSVLLGVGYKKKKAVARGDYSIVPMIGPRIAGGSVTVSF